jgi:hypothetical protein
MTTAMIMVMAMMAAVAIANMRMAATALHAIAKLMIKISLIRAGVLIPSGIQSPSLHLALMDALSTLALTIKPTSSISWMRVLQSHWLKSNTA